MVIGDGATVSLATNLMRVAELENAFRFSADLVPRSEPYSVDEVIAAVATLHPAIELADSRYTSCTAVGAPQLIADDACANLFILGPALPRPWRHIDLAVHRVSATVAGKSRHDGQGANVLGDPRRAQTWIANELFGLGIAIMAGQVVTTGACVVPIPVLGGDEVIARCGEVGSLSVKFA